MGQGETFIAVGLEAMTAIHCLPSSEAILYSTYPWLVLLLV